MTKELFIAREKGGERTLLVQMRIYQGDHHAHFDEALQEFQSLAESAAANVIDVISGNLSQPSPKYFVGEGKAAEIAEHVKTHKIDLVIVNHKLSPAQSRNLEKLLKCRVHDRSELILDIFSQRARTFEGKLQVELAQLEHLSSRLVRGWTHLERQKGGIGMRGGPGETQLELDHRLIADKIKLVKKRLEKVVTQRDQSRRARQRSQLPVIAIVGYTNAGKSTLFNRLTQSTVYVANQLFATLDTTCRNIIFPKIGKVMLADTVGFVRQLPHELIAAFKATLEETRQADLLLHIVDSHDTSAAETIATVNGVLKEIGAGAIPQLLIMNKIDLTKEKSRIDYDEHHRPEKVWISCIKEIGLDLLTQAVSESLAKRLIECQITLTPDQGKLRAKLFALGVVKSEKVDKKCVAKLTLEIQQLDFERLFCMNELPVNDKANQQQAKIDNKNRRNRR